MLPTFAGYEAVDEVRTDAFTVVYRAHRIGENGNSAAYQIRTLRNPANIVDQVRWKANVAARLAAIDAQRRAADQKLDCITPLLESGAEDGVVFDVTPACEFTARDIVLQRIALDGREMHALATGVIQAIIAFHNAAKRPHGRIEPESIRILSMPITWDMQISLDLAASPSAAGEGEKGDLRDLGRLFYELAFFEPPGLQTPEITTDNSAYAATGRRAASWRRLCKDLLVGAEDAATLAGVEKRIRALRPPTPSQIKSRAIIGSTAAVIAIAGGVFAVTRPGEQPIFRTPDEDLFYDLEQFTVLWRIEWSAGSEDGLITRLSADAEIARSIDLLSLYAIRENKEDFKKWSSKPHSDITRTGAFRHAVIDWSRPAVGQWWDAYEELRTALRVNLVEPLASFADEADARGWTQQATELRDASTQMQTMIDAEDFAEIGDLVASAGAQYDNLSNWLRQIAEIDATVDQAVATIAATPARAPGPDGEPVAINDALQAWADQVGRASSGEAPDDTIRRYRDISAAVIETVADAAKYWNDTPEFMVDEFLAASEPMRPDDVANPAQGRRVLLAWASRVQEPGFLNIGADPRPALLARRDDLQQVVQARIASLSDADRALSQDRLSAFQSEIALVEETLGPQATDAWSSTNEQPIRQAVVAAEAQLAQASDQWTDLQNYLEERQNIEARRTGVVTRANELAQEHNGWLASRLQPLVTAASSAGPDQIESTVDSLSQEVQRLRPLSRTRDALDATLATVAADPRIVGDSLRARGQALLTEWTQVAPDDESENQRLQASIEQIGTLSGGATSLAAVIDQRALPATSPELLDQMRAMLQSLRDVGVDPAAGAQGGRLLRILTQVEPYLAAESDWPALLARLRADVSTDAFRSESLLLAYAMLREAESSSSPAFSIAEIQLERDIRSRLAATFDTLPATMTAPAIASRLDQWLATRPPTWSDAVTALGDMNRAATLAGADSQPNPATDPVLAAASLVLQMQAYQGPVDDDAAVLAQAAQYQSTLATIRQALPGATPWYLILEDLDNRLTALQSGESGPTLTPELLQTTGPGARGWTLRADATIERPVYERNGISLEFILDDQQETPVFVGRRELSLGALQEILSSANAEEWGVFSAHAPLKTWGVEPDLQQPGRTARGYFVTNQRGISLYQDWVVPAAIHVEPGRVAWDAHYAQVYGADASDAQRWSPTMETPAHLIGFQGALALARAVGCRLPTPDEWVGAFANIGGVDGAAANVSDATWTRQQDRSSREVPSPWLGSFFPFGRTDTPEAYESADDSWLWLRPTPQPAGSQIADMIGNVAEWADARARERTVDEPLEIPSAAVQADASVMGISSMSGAGSPDQRVAVGNRAANRSSMTTSRDAYGMGFADVGVRLFFDVGAIKPASASEQFATELAESLLAAGPGAS